MLNYVKKVGKSAKELKKKLICIISFQEFLDIKNIGEAFEVLQKKNEIWLANSQ